MEKNSISVLAPLDMRSKHDGAIGNFGIPEYGGSMVGSVVYPQKGSFGCVPFEGDKPFKSRSSPTTILLLDRGGIPDSSLFFNSCLFVGNLIYYYKRIHFSVMGGSCLFLLLLRLPLY